MAIHLLDSTSAFYVRMSSCQCGTNCIGEVNLIFNVNFHIKLNFTFNCFFNNVTVQRQLSDFFFAQGCKGTNTQIVFGDLDNGMIFFICSEFAEVEETCFIAVMHPEPFAVISRHDLILRMPSQLLHWWLKVEQRGVVVGGGSIDVQLDREWCVDGCPAITVVLFDKATFACRSSAPASCVATRHAVVAVGVLPVCIAGHWWRHPEPFRKSLRNISRNLLLEPPGSTQTVPEATENANAICKHCQTKNNVSTILIPMQNINYYGYLLLQLYLCRFRKSMLIKLNSDALTCTRCKEALE